MLTFAMTETFTLSSNKYIDNANKLLTLHICAK